MSEPISIDELIGRVFAEADRRKNVEQIAATLTQAGELRGSIDSVRTVMHLQPHFTVRPDRHYHLNDFVQYHGSPFVVNCFRGLLGRWPDPHGFNHFNLLLCQGAEKAEIIARISRSQEGRMYAAQVDGLYPRAYLSYLQYTPVIGRLLRWLMAFANLGSMVRNQRATEAYFASKNDEIAGHFGTVTGGLVESVEYLGKQIKNTR